MIFSVMSYERKNNIFYEKPLKLPKNNCSVVEIVKIIFQKETFKKQKYNCRFFYLFLKLRTVKLVKIFCLKNKP